MNDTKGGIQMAITSKKIDVWAKKKKTAKLIKASSPNQTPEIRIAAIKALGNIENEAVMNKLIEYLRDPDPQIRLHSVEALGNIGNPRSKEFVLYTSNNDYDEDVRKYAVEALRKIKDKIQNEEEQ